MVDPPLDPPFALLLPMTRQSPLPYVRGPVRMHWMEVSEEKKSASANCW